MCEKSANWIWYANDFELFAYHNMIKKRRQRKDLLYPTWMMDRPEYQVVFLGQYNVPEKTSFKIYHNGIITVNVNDKPWYVENPNGEITLEAGCGTIRVYCMAEVGLPCIFIDSKYVKTDETWLSYCVDNKMQTASTNPMFTKKNFGPMDYKLPTRKLKAKTVKKINGGMLYDFGRELVGQPVILAEKDITFNVFYGESEQEALDYKYSEVCDDISVKAHQKTIAEDSKGFRYIFIKNAKNLIDLYVLEEVYKTTFTPIFKSNNKRLNKIYSTSKYTLEVTSREFFIDGPKRDRWVWAGDVLQSEWFDFYSFFDKEIVKRTLTAIIGKQEIRSNVSGILDYNFYYILSVYFYYRFTGDLDFVKHIFPRLESLMRFIFTKPKVDGFLMAKNEWIFIDWTDIKDFGKINNSSPICLIQILYYTCLKVMMDFENRLGIEKNPKYAQEILGLKERINQVYFDKELGGYYHDSAHTIKTKYANIFAIILDFADEEQKAIISEKFTDKEFAEIYTPYMKFYELCALAESGKIDYVIDYIDYYWGGMLEHGATTFWERYNPNEIGNEKYAMYGRPYGKSLCHSWGAGPLYLIGKYIVGLSPYNDGYSEFILKPYLKDLHFNSKLPINDSEINVSYDGKWLKIYSSKTDGYLFHNEKIINEGLEFDKEKGGYLIRGGVEYKIKIKGD